MKELTSEDLLRRLTAEMIELKTSGAGMRLEIAPETAFAVVACVQLALRHPHANLGPAADLVRDFIEYVRAKFEGHAPAIAEAIRRGNEPEHDPPRQAEPFVRAIEQDAKVEDGGISIRFRPNEPFRDVTPAPPDPRIDRLIHRGRGLMEFRLAHETPPTPEEIVAFMDSRRDPPAAVLTCPHCGFSQPAPFEKVDLFICAKCGRTVETT
jgi:hypothetical protein